MNFKDLVKPLELKTKIVTIDDKEISVKQYLTADDRYDLIEVTLQNSFEDGLYNKTKLDVYFHLGLVYLYTDLEFTDEDREDEAGIYDYLMASGIMNQILYAIPANQYTELWETLTNTIEDKMRFSNTAAGILSKFINDLPKNAEAAKGIVDNFDPEKYQAVLNFAKAANGGRDILSNLMTNVE